MAKRFQKHDKRFLGLGKAGAIRGFFGTNAILSIAILLLICVFLAKEAFLFFPGHHEELGLFRQSGQEHVDYQIRQVDEFTELNSLVNQAYFAEFDVLAGRERGLIDAFYYLVDLAEDAGEDEIDEWADARDDLLDARDEGEVPADVVEAEAQARKNWQERLQTVLSGASREEADPDGRLQAEDWTTLLQAMPEWDPVEEEPPPLVVKAEESLKERMSGFDEARGLFSGAIVPLRDHKEKFRMLTMAIKEEAIADRTAAARKAALEEGAKNSVDPAKRQEKLDRAAAIVVRKEFPFAERVEPVYESKPEYEKIAGQFLVDFESARKALPVAVASPVAEARLRELRERTPGFLKDFQDDTRRALEWRHDASISWVFSVGSFFFGREWVTNSSWHDFFGLLPLFTGSLLISVIALAVAVPFAVGAAIYVNQLALPWEQSVVKPSIEFIQAIPSVVLGFFGIIVLGSGLRELSQVEWLSWIPGFPMQERLNILNAGLLLALMAVPTVFTLCEDALNNVPRAFTDASLALGASKLQTVMKVVAPAAASGILAAILLGFGRIIGETMVVLLVAGNQIEIPDLSLGIGVVTQPAHTMTGIIAQETGEVVPGSLHWRALFMVGLILFLIALLINYLAQKVIQRFQFR